MPSGNHGIERCLNVLESHNGRGIRFKMGRVCSLSFDPESPEPMPRHLKITVTLLLLGMIAFAHQGSAQSLDTLKVKVKVKSDSIQQALQHNSIGKADSIQQSIQHRIDSKADSITGKVTGKIDSVQNRLNNKIDSLENKINKAGSKINSAGDKVNSLEQKANSIPGVDIKAPDIKVNDHLNLNPDLKTPDLNTPDLNTPNLNTPNLNTPNLKTPDLKTPDINSIDQINDIKEAAGKVKSIEGEVKDLPKTIDTRIENKAMELDEIKELQKQTGEMGKAKEIINANNPDALKEQAQQQIKQQAINHFKGKEEALQGAMDKLSKLKQKYSEVSSLKDLPKRPPNPMKGKPLIERILPGVTLQINNTSRAFMIDVNPVVSYRFSGRINAGLGWNERFAFTKWNKLSSYDRIYGPRVFGSFAFKKGFAAKAEIEKMNTLVPITPHSQDGSRMWVWSAFVGLKKDYKFMGKVKGNVQMLYNLWDDHDNSPYSDRLNVRMGFEFPMKKPKKPAEKAKK